ncbi:MAG: hypothetical protein ACLP9K_10120 [Nitrososphaerales archaeon]
MLYWGFEDDIALAIVVLSVLCIYYAFAITRTTKGAPRGWYVIVVAFVVGFVFRVTQLYFDVQSPSNLIDVEEAAISLLALLLFVAGLWMLNSSFRRRVKAAQAS